MHRLVVRSPRSLVPRFSYSLSTRVTVPPAQSFSHKVTPPSDPYPLPLQSDIAAQTPPDLIGFLPPLVRGDETPETLRARLVYQSRKRGTLEADLLLSTFAAEHLPSMSVPELREFDKLMDEPDWDIYYWTIGKRAPPERWAQSALLANLSKHAANEGKVVRRMPDLSAAKV